MQRKLLCSGKRYQGKVSSLEAERVLGTRACKLLCIQMVYRAWGSKIALNTVPIMGGRADNQSHLGVT